ncbi:MAG: zinc ribbon domain-containing protein [Bacteroides sp.]|nr:zinc ribbon domain-containing protein [Bacillota bacterium]MCM1393497.1 zinc ribbon domain-containing protein [[Eubacterium] siraeum]MCM1455090.1 zinc ribbon domain-containing protein [Bacteroides sp.]
MGETKNCKKCGALCDEIYKFCPNCGANLESDKCSQCGAELIDGAKFCINCGASIDSEDEIVEKETENEEDVKKTVVVKKSEADNFSTKNYILRIVRNVSVFILCAILFALSFCNIVKINADKYIGIGINGCDISVSAVDIIDIMCATAVSDANEDKYADELLELSERLEQYLKKDYNERLEKYYLSAKTKSLIHDLVIVYYKDYLCDESAKGSSLYNNIIIGGTFSLLNILFCAAMFIVATISLMAAILKKRSRVSKYLYFMPLYLFISLMILFLVKTTLGVGTDIAGAMVAALFFEAVAIVVTIVLIITAKKKKSLKTAIPKIVSIAMSIVICACLFAPMITAQYELVLKNKSHLNTYDIPVDAGCLLTYLSDYERENVGTDPESREVYEKYIETLLASTSETTAYEFKDLEGEILARTIMRMLVYISGNYSAMGALSVGYYALLLVFLIFGAFAVWATACLFKKSNEMYYLFSPIMVFIVTVLACSIGFICDMNYHLEDMPCNFTIGGGPIAALVLSIITLIFASVFKSVVDEKRIKSTDSSDEVAEDFIQ